MKKVLVLLTFGWLAGATNAWAAQDDPHAGHNPPGVAQAAEDDDQADGEGAHGQAAGGGQHDHAKAGGRLQENMKRMQTLMARMQATTDPAQRRAMLGEHLQVMREQVKLILAQAGGQAHGGEAAASAEGGHEDHAAQSDQPGSAGGKKKNKKGGMMGGGMMGGGMMKMHEKMEQRVQMLELLLEQMVEHEAVEHELESR
jgi:hypothetical protein